MADSTSIMCSYLNCHWLCLKQVHKVSHEKFSLHICLLSTVNDPASLIVFCTLHAVATTMPDGLSNPPGLLRSESCTYVWKACLTIKDWNFYITISSIVSFRHCCYHQFDCCGCCCCCFIIIIIISIIIINTINYHFKNARQNLFNMQVSCKMCIFFQELFYL